MRVRIAVCVGQSCREVERKVLEGWLALQGAEFERFVVEICGWSLEGGSGGKGGGGGGGGGGVVLIPTNKENEAKGTVVRENVQFDRTFDIPPLGFCFSFLLSFSARSTQSQFNTCIIITSNLFSSSPPSPSAKRKQPES